MIAAQNSPILVSIHQNYFTEGKYYGAQVFYAGTPTSKALAEQMQSALIRFLEPSSRRKIKKADGIYLMEHIQCPGILIECGFLSNYNDAQKLTDPAYQKKLCTVIAGTLSSYMNSES